MNAINRKERNQGMNWISQHKRLAIYLRDGLACCYCGNSDCQLTLDHIKPHSKGGTNHESNLVTCCLKCNSSRGNRSYSKFANDTANYLNHGTKGSDIVNHIKKCIRRILDISYAKELVERQGSCFKALNNLKNN
jgi:5-methylcytosine-specific restriction endonuclease McrA